MLKCRVHHLIELLLFALPLLFPVVTLLFHYVFVEAFVCWYPFGFRFWGGASVGVLQGFLRHHFVALGAFCCFLGTFLVDAC